MILKLNLIAFEKLQGDITDAEFSEILGIGRTQLWRIKVGKTSPGYKFVAGFLKAFPNEKFEDYFFTDDVACLERNANERH